MHVTEHLYQHYQDTSVTKCDVINDENLPTAYFLAGGSAKWPSLKAAAYFSFLEVRFCWIAEAILVPRDQLSMTFGCLESVTIFTNILST